MSWAQFARQYRIMYEADVFHPLIHSQNDVSLHLLTGPFRCLRALSIIKDDYLSCEVGRLIFWYCEAFSKP